ncbi:MAG: alpha/beta hydrolase [Acidobacteria bacterium]|nr:alpha/beta hydrolase [Acidobacteriota bacterium]MDW7984716.1 alpha/beta fold hydrolase [Acidobacteriota bacterium]
MATRLEWTALDVALHRPAVVFLHAFPMDRRMWRPQVGALADLGIPCIALDYPGFGAAPPWPFLPTIDDYARYVLDTLERLGVPQAVYVGLSMGGYVALALYRQAPDRFRGLVLADTRATADTEGARERRFQLIEATRRARSVDPLVEAHIDKLFTPRTRAERPGVVQEAERLMRMASPVGAIQALWAMADRPDSTGLLPRMNFPVLVVVGAEDPVTPPAEAQAMAECIPQADLVVLPEAAHLANMEQPEAFNEALRKYLARVL